MIMDAAHLPAVVGPCIHCGLPLYAAAPLAVKPRGETGLAHVACEVNEHRGEAR